MVNKFSHVHIVLVNRIFRTNSTNWMASVSCGRTGLVSKPEPSGFCKLDTDQWRIYQKAE